MVYTIFGFDYIFDLNFFQLCFLASLIGLISKYLLNIVKIEYFSLGSNSVLVFTLLPAIGFVITSAISNNIALSLGMVGALSIVRFRTPIKNPLELVIYFYLITLGIVTNVDPSISINFLVFFITVVLISQIYNLIGYKLDFNSSDLKNYTYFLRLETKSDLDILNNNVNLLHKSFSTLSFTFNLGFHTFEDVKEFIKEINTEAIIR